MEHEKEKLRSGYTTGACAAAAAKAAAMMLLGSEKIKNVTIPFPDGGRIQFKVQSSRFRVEDGKGIAHASIIKDAGDDPDVTHGAEITASVRCSEFKVQSAEIQTHPHPCPLYKLPSLLPLSPGGRGTKGEGALSSGGIREGMGLSIETDIIIRGGTGVGIVTKPGLAVPVGEPAINPVPRKMITDAVREAIREFKVQSSKFSDRVPNLEVTISVPKGEELAKKTLNHRLGIIGGISILGTTGIVRPVSAEAWTATIKASMDVAKAAGLASIVLSSGRTSEKAHMKKFHLPEESYAMMGDYIEFSLEQAKTHGFKTIHLCSQWAKMLKTAMGAPQTHVRHGALEAAQARDFLIGLGISIPTGIAFNTSRAIFDYITNDTLSFRERDGVRVGYPQTPLNPSPPDLPLKGRLAGSNSAFYAVCSAAKRYAEGITSGILVTAHLVSYEGEILASSG